MFRTYFDRSTVILGKTVGPLGNLYIRTNNFADLKPFIVGQRIVKPFRRSKVTEVEIVVTSLFLWGVETRT